MHDSLKYSLHIWFVFGREDGVVNTFIKYRYGTNDSKYIRGQNQQSRLFWYFKGSMIARLKSGKCKALHFERRIQKHKYSIGSNWLSTRTVEKDQGKSWMWFIVILLRYVNRDIMWRTRRGGGMVIIWVLPRPLIEYSCLVLSAVL